MRNTVLSMKNTELPFVKEMFEQIAPRYDLLNRLLSLRQDVYWRKTMVSAMQIHSNGLALDVACGTCDVGIEILRQKGSGVTVFGVDFSPAMLMLARNKIIKKKKAVFVDSNIHLFAGNAFNLPFKTETFDVITIAFGIRNIGDKLSVLKSFHDRLKKGGMLLVLELAAPERGFLSLCYLFYFKKILPLIGWFFSKNSKAYKYLPSSVMNFPNSDAFAAIMHSAGFKDIRWKKMTMGIVTLYAGYKSV